MELISIIMPTYNIGGKALTGMFIKSVNSIMKQTHSNVELIIVDDASKDSSVKIIKEQVQKDTRIKAVKLDTNVGPGAARNVGFNLASGKYVSFQDADDYSVPDRFEKLLRNMPDYGIITSSLVMDYGVKKRIRKYGEDKFYIDVSNIRPKPRLHFSSALLTNELYKKMGGMEPYKYSSDSLLALKISYFMKMIGTTNAIKSVDEILFHWIRRTSSVTMHKSTKGHVHKMQGKQRKPLIELLKKIRDKQISLPVSEAEAIKLLGIVDNISKPDVQWSAI